MSNNVLKKFFDEYITKDSVFLRKEVLQSSFIPGEVIHRVDEVKQIANVLAPSLKFEKPSNIFVYGKTGTGKTLTLKHISNELMDAAKNQDTKLKIVYTNCKLKRTADTEYRLIAQILYGLGVEVPMTGLPTEELYKMLYGNLEKKNQITILVLDEIDYLVNRAGDGVLYNLTRTHEITNSKISIVGISNDVTFASTLDPRVKSSLSEEEIIFPPYNALQIQDILRERASKAFKENVVDSGVIEKCAAYAAREHGDARRALELLRVSGEVADRNNTSVVALCDVDSAEKKIDRDMVYDLVATQPKQYHIVLYSILCLCGDDKKIFTGDIYSFYKELCSKLNVRGLTQRRVSDIIAEFDMLGVVSATLVSKGRYGRTREINLSLQSDTLSNVESFIKSELGVSDGESKRTE